PRVTRVAFLAYKGDSVYRLFVKEAQDAADRFAMQIQPVVIGGSAEVEGAFSGMSQERARGLGTQTPFIIVSRQRRRIVELTTRHRLPSVTDFMEYADAGGLMSYGPNPLEAVRRAPVYVDKILKGAKPGDLPIEQPTKFQLVINLKTAKQIGVTIP